MSIKSFTDQTAITIKRKVTTQGGAGGQGAISYTTAQRTTDGVATSTTAWVTTIKASENIKFGVRSDTLVWKALFATNPVLTSEDLLEFTDNNSTTRSVRCLHRSEDVGGMGLERLWRVHCEEVGNEA